MVHVPASEGASTGARLINVSRGLRSTARWSESLRVCGGNSCDGGVVTPAIAESSREAHDHFRGAARPAFLIFFGPSASAPLKTGRTARSRGRFAAYLLLMIS